MTTDTNFAPGSDRAALLRLVRYLEQDPQNERLKCDVFDEALRVGALDVATDLVKRSLPLSDPQWEHRRGLLALRTGEYREAELCFRRLLEVGEHPSIRYNLAFALLQQRNYSDAKSEAERVLAQETIVPETLELWLRAMHCQHELDEGLNTFRAYLGSAWVTPGAYGVASLMAVDAALLNDGRMWARQALQGDPQQLDALTALGSIELASQKTGSARHYLGEALSVSPRDGRVWSAMAMCDMLDLRLGDARTSFDKAVDFMPEHIGTWHGLGWCCIAMKDLEEAMQAFRSALIIDRNFPESHGGVAVVAAMQGRVGEARDAAAVALRLDAGCLSASYALALLDGEVGDATAYKRLVERMLRTRPNVAGDGSLYDVVARYLDAGAGDRGA